jgi:hypothetical protein
MYSRQEIFGDDIDGNRGELRTYFYFEDGDREEIVSQIKETYPDGDYPTTMEICLIDTTTDKDEWVEVVVKDYIK